MDRIVSENYSCQRRRQKGSKKPLFGTCQVCGDKAPHQQHYGCKAEVCYSCRAFFRRCVKKNIIPVKIQCNSFLIKAGTCQIKPETRSVCRYVNYQKTGGKYRQNIGLNVNKLSRFFSRYFSYCRYQKCCTIGLNKNFVMTKDDIAEMKEKIHEAKITGIRCKYLALTNYEKRCKDQIEVDLNGWEPEEDFLQWLLKGE